MTQRTPYNHTLSNQTKNEPHDMTIEFQGAEERYVLLACDHLFCLREYSLPTSLI